MSTAAEIKKLFTTTEVPAGIIITKFKSKEATVVEVPSEIGGKPVVAIGEKAFMGKNIEEVILPDSLIVIGERAFCDCKQLAKVSLDEKVKMDRFTFVGCEKLVDDKGFLIVNHTLISYSGQDIDVVIPDSVKIIDDSAFMRKKIETVKLSENVEEIRNNAFFGCKKLRSISVDANKVKVTSAAFEDCFELFDEDGFLIFGDYLCSYRNADLADGVVIVPEGIRVIGADSFPTLPRISRIELPEGVESIGTFAFMHCSSSLETMKVPASVKEIGKDAFWGCKQLTIEAPAGCYVCEYAKENGIACSTN